MSKKLRRFTTLILILSLVVIPFGTSVLADQSDIGPDLVVVRPLGIVATTVGTTLFVITLPFSLLSGNVKQASDVLVKNPFEFTFKRPLGEFDSIWYIPSR